MARRAPDIDANAPEIKETVCEAMEPVPFARVAGPLLDWYDRHARELPWRLGPQEKARPGSNRRIEPYHVWLSEIMLQQTTVATVKSYFEKFLSLWPTVQDLAAAEQDEVLAAWAGLGYYARARNLHRCAKVVSEELGGIFPTSKEELLKLPGVGDYTASAVAAIAFDRPETVVDGNVERVTARLFAVDEPMPKAKPRLKKLAATLTPQERPGDFAQAMMDLGATVCTPRNPACALCPLMTPCAARRAGIAADLPKKAAKKAKPTRRAKAYVLQDGEGRVLLRRRAEHGLLGGMLEVPTGPWAEGERPAVAPELESLAEWQGVPGTVRHTFTHFHFEIEAVVGRLEVDGLELEENGLWALPHEFGDKALPTVMRKVLRHALEK